MRETSDEDLVAEAVATGDRDIFAILVRRHQSRVRNWLRQLTRDHALADDLAQNAFVRVWEKLYSFSGSGSFASWLMKIAYNEFLQYKRKNKRAEQLIDAFGADPVAMETQHFPAVDHAMDLPRMLGVLSDEERIAMVLNYAYGMSHREVSDITEMPVGTVKSHIRRGRDKIRDSFGLEGNISD